MVSPWQREAAVGDLQEQGLSMRTSCTLVQVERKGLYYKPKLRAVNQQISGYVQNCIYQNLWRKSEKPEKGYTICSKVAG